MHKIIIDCDPGHDDIMAIITALAHLDKLQILGISTVAGNNTLDNVTNNILKVEEYLGINIPVYKGYDRPIVKPAMPQDAHGVTGMDGPILNEPSIHPSDKHAFEFFKDTLSNNDDVTIVGLGPLTNIAMFIATFPELKDNIKQIVIMGGAIGDGNINKHAEFNIWHDPEAAKIIFDSGIKVVMAPLEVCLSGAILISETKQFTYDKKVNKLIRELFDFYCLYAIERNWDKDSIFDVVPIVYLLNPELFKYELGNVDVVLDGIDTQGQTIFEKDSNGNHIVLLETDREKFIKVFVDAVNYLDDN